MKIVIDRIEGDFAVAELPDKSFVNIPVILFPDAKDGDIYMIEKTQNEYQKEQVKKLTDSLFK